MASASGRRAKSPRRLQPPLVSGGACGCGGIGRRTRFRIWRRKAWGFKSLHPHQWQGFRRSEDRGSRRRGRLSPEAPGPVRPSARARPSRASAWMFLAALQSSIHLIRRQVLRLCGRRRGTTCPCAATRRVPPAWMARGRRAGGVTWRAVVSGTSPFAFALRTISRFHRRSADFSGPRGT